MKPHINMIGILTSRLHVMRDFYVDVLGFEVLLEMENYVEFVHEGVRFALSTHAVMHQATGHEGYSDAVRGHGFELAFEEDSPENVDTSYAQLIEAGATPIREPATMPWGQRTAFFADPDGNIHEIFTNISTV